MMSVKVPTSEELQQLLHLDGFASLGARSQYDPVKAHQYYEQHKHLKGRRKGSTQPTGAGRPRQQRPAKSRARQKAELQARITNLSKKLQELEQLIQVKEAALKRSQASAKSTAKKERSAKEKNKPQTAAEKAKAARDAKQYRQKHRQELKTKAKQASQKSGGGSSKKGASQKPRDMHIKDLKALATKVKGQLAVAKQKLAAL
jgi:Tfp pilus assembly protein FimV